MRRFAGAIAVAGCAVLLAAPLSQAAAPASETRQVSRFDTVVFAVPSEVSIEQAARETVTLEGERSVLDQLTTEVHGRQLVVGVASGQLKTPQPIRVRLGVQALRSIESRAPNAIRTGPLRTDALALVLTGGGSVRVERLDNARKLNVRIIGAGDVAIGGGTVNAQQLAIRGAGSYSAPRLTSESADVAIDGQGEVQLAASGALAVRIAGIGHVGYRGEPVVTRSIRGIGSIEKE